MSYAQEQIQKDIEKKEAMWEEYKKKHPYYLLGVFSKDKFSKQWALYCLITPQT